MSGNFEEFRAQGSELGLEGQELAKYVSEAQNAAREERALERQIEREREELAHEREREREERAHEREREGRAHELKMAELRSQTPAGDNNNRSNAIARPKLPQFSGDSDISCFFTHFEKIASILGIADVDLAAYLGSNISGKAAEIFVSLSTEEMDSYATVKSTLLQAFGKTADSYRQEVKTMKIDASETYNNFARRMKRVADLWIEAFGCDRTFEGLCELIYTDLFLGAVGPELRTYLKDRCEIRSVMELASFADRWSSIKRPQPPKKDREVRFQHSVNNNSDNSWRRASSDSDGSWRKVSSDVISKESQPKCFTCGEHGHKRYACPKNPLSYANKKRDSIPEIKFSFALDDVAPREYLVCGTVNGSRVSTIYRDTGCSTVVVAEDLLPNIDLSKCKRRSVMCYLGRVDTFPVVRCFIDCPYFQGWVDALRAPIKFCSVLIGNVPGAKAPESVSSEYEKDECKKDECKKGECKKGECKEDKCESDELTVPVPDSLQEHVSRKDVVAVVTRASREKSKHLHPLVLPQLKPLHVTPLEFAELQGSCKSLEEVREKEKIEKTIGVPGKRLFKFVTEKNLLYRECVESFRSDEIGKKTLVVPDQCRKTVLSIAHESPLAGHFSHRKTELRVRDHFYWPRLSTDVLKFCRSCDRCQRISARGAVKPAPLVKVPIITEPFSRVAIDLVGPLLPASAGGHKYLLTLIDYSTGFPEALPLKDIDSISVAEALLQIFSRVGIPREIISDRGTQFTSQLMGELHRLLGVKPIFCSPYHPAANGRVERLHSTLKTCLKKLCIDKPRDWHRYIVPTMFALREMPCDRTGFSAFELLYGRQVRGPVTVLRDLWEDTSIADTERPLFQYVIETRERLEDCAKLAAQNAGISAAKYKSYFDNKSQKRKFVPGDEVLVLLPSLKQKLLMAWSGPHRVLEQRGTVNYLIDFSGKEKVFHINLLKRYHRRAVKGLAHVADEVNEVRGGALEICKQCIITDDDDFDGNAMSQCKIEEIPVLSSGEECVPEISSELNSNAKCEIRELVSEYDDIFSQKPGRTDTVIHDIQLMTNEPIRPKMYPVPMHLQHHFDNEVDKLLELGIIQPSKSPYSAPVVLVKKPDGSYRMTIDYRGLNAITVFDAEPACNADAELHKFAGAEFFSELDVTKAYYQIDLSKRAQPLTAFPTKRGLMEFRRLPFGLVGACATYTRLMRIVLADLPNTTFYFDNIYVYSSVWPDHMTALRNVFERLRQHGLTAQPSKCRFGLKSLQYLGFDLEVGLLSPQEGKIKAIVSLPPPNTKKALRSFLGLVSFYRKFISQAATLTAPMSDMLRKGIKEPLEWSNPAKENFDKLKESLARKPVLKLPNPEEKFVLRTDASNTGLGAVLLQYHNNSPHPVAYASRKLLDREKNYSTIEKECLAIIFAAEKFRYYLLGKEFLLETDHKPLVYLNKAKYENSRIMRWALSLQPYRFTVIHIDGEDNVGADLLSRSEANAADGPTNA